MSLWDAVKESLVKPSEFPDAPTPEHPPQSYPGVQAPKPWPEPGEDPTKTEAYQALDARLFATNGIYSRFRIAVEKLKGIVPAGTEFRVAVAAGGIDLNKLLVDIRDISEKLIEEIKHFDALRKQREAEDAGERQAAQKHEEQQKLLAQAKDLARKAAAIGVEETTLRAQVAERRAAHKEVTRQFLAAADHITSRLNFDEVALRDLQKGSS